jgi:putative inorganic carbon (hco3(-)) transporter
MRSVHVRGEGRRETAPSRTLRSLVLLGAIVVGALVGTSPFLGALLVSVAFLGMVVTIKPDWATIAAVVLLYSNAAVVANHVHGLPKPVAQAAALLLAIALAHHLGLKQRPLIVPSALPWIIVFLLVQVVGLVYANDPSVAAESVVDFILSGLFLYVAFTNAIRNEALLRQSLWAVLLVGAVLGGVALHQSATANYDDEYLGFAQVSDAALERLEETPPDEPPSQPRAEGPIGEKNRFAQLLFAVVPIGVMLLVGHPLRSRRLLASGLTALVLVGGALTVSRGGAVGLGLTLVVLAALRYVPVRHLVIALFGIVLLLSAVSPRYIERLSTMSSVGSLLSEEGATDEVDGSTLGRMGANVAAFRVFIEHPILGVGPGMFNVYYREQAIEAGYRVHSDTRSAHNMILQIAAEYGLLGALALFGAVGVTLRDLHRARRGTLERRPELAALLGGVFGAILCYLATGAFLSYAYVRYFWFLLALGSAAVAVASAGAEGGPRLGRSARGRLPALVSPEPEGTG